MYSETAKCQYGIGWPSKSRNCPVMSLVASPASFTILSATCSTDRGAWQSTHESCPSSLNAWHFAFCKLLTVRPLAFPMSVWTWPGLTERKTTWKFLQKEWFAFFLYLLCHQHHVGNLIQNLLSSRRKNMHSPQECRERSTWWVGSRQTLNTGRRWPCKSWTHSEGSWVRI